MSANNKEIILQVAILTYNHKDYITNTINSILKQKTNFEFSIIIVDDCSNDGTTEILKKFQENNLDKISLYINNSNIGTYKSALKLAGFMDAKYQTWLDGDDSWCNENKLQTQIDFLERNLDYIGCFHDAEIIQHNRNEDINLKNRTQIHWKTYSQFNKFSSDFMPWAVIERNIIPTASLVFRDINIKNFVENFKFNQLSLSWALHLEIIKNSKLKYFNETWSIYNDHPEGISKKHDIVDFKYNNIRILENLLSDKVWDYYHAEIYKAICNEYRFILKSKQELSKSQRDYKKSLKQYQEYLKLASKSDIQQLKDDYHYVRDNGMVE